ncbi:MAG: hypothetical protein ACYDDF_14205 [Thermoplasmatota archaeon]
MVDLLDPQTWDLWTEIYIGLATTVVIVVAGYYLGVWWQKWRDQR